MKKILVIVVGCMLMIISMGCSSKDGSILELDSNDLTTYKAISKRQDDELIKSLEPVNIVKMYFYSLYQQNYSVSEMLLADEGRIGYDLLKDQLQEGRITTEDLEELKAIIASAKEFKLISKTDETAFVQFKLNYPENKNQYSTHDIKLKKQDDIWKISLAKEAIINPK